MSSEEDFDDIIEMLGGFGKYQKRLLYLLLGPLFFIMPFPLLHQVQHLDLDPNLDHDADLVDAGRGWKVPEAVAYTPARSPLLYHSLQVSNTLTLD